MVLSPLAMVVADEWARGRDSENVDLERIFPSQNQERIMGQPFVDEITMFAGNFAPNGWEFCAGQLLSISENDTLFQLIGTTYGGDGHSLVAVAPVGFRADGDEEDRECPGHRMIEGEERLGRWSPGGPRNVSVNGSARGLPAGAANQLTASSTTVG